MQPTRHTLSKNIRAQSVQLLNKHLTAGIGPHALVKQAHWNVRGPGFISRPDFARVRKMVRVLPSAPASIELAQRGLDDPIRIWVDEGVVHKDINR